MSSPVANLLDGLIGQFSAGSELAPLVTKQQRSRLLRGLFDSYYADIDRPVIVDTNRAWTAQLPTLLALFPDARIICCVRDVAWIMDSLERQYRDNVFENTLLFGSPGERATVYTRLEALAGANRIVGYAWHALREACYSEHADRMVIVDYELLATRPADVLALVYRFLDEEPFTHDFADVRFDAPSIDRQLGLDGLHRVHPIVAPRPRETILPPDLFARFSGMAFWRDLPGSRAFRIVPSSALTTADTSVGGEAPALD
jgi:sulfotransferase